MLLRQFNFAFVYILCLAHLGALLAPFCVLVYLFLSFIYKADTYVIFGYVKELFLVSLFMMSFACCLYIILDYCFGFTISSLSKGAKDVKLSKEYSDINALFIKIKDKFNNPKVDLFIKESHDINAFAIGGFKKSRIILTTGIVNHINTLSDNDEDFLQSLGGIIAHEMSHVVNMDFLPGVILYVTHAATLLMSKLLYAILAFLCFWMNFIPIVGRLAKLITKLIHRFTIFVVQKLMYGKVVMPLSTFISLALSRRTEYRSDMDSAKALGGDAMAAALEKVGSDFAVWKTIFSTHPRPRARIKRIASVSRIDGRIMPNFFTDFANMWCMLMLFFATIFLGVNSNVRHLPHYSMKVYELSCEKYILIKAKVDKTIEIGRKIYKIYQIFT